MATGVKPGDPLRSGLPSSYEKDTATALCRSLVAGRRSAAAPHLEGFSETCAPLPMLQLCEEASKLRV